MKLHLNKMQVLCSYLGQKVVLTKAMDDGVLLYPVGAVGTLDAFQATNADPVAVVIFDDDPTKDSVHVSMDDFMPVEFIQEGYELKKVKIDLSPRYRLARLKHMVRPKRN